MWDGVEVQRKLPNRFKQIITSISHQRRNESSVSRGTRPFSKAGIHDPAMIRESKEKLAIEREVCKIASGL